MDADFCFLFGSSHAPESCRAAVVEALEKCYAEHNIRCFVVGGYGNFDSIGISSLREFKKIYGDIVLLLLTPYHPYVRPVDPPRDFDGTYYPPGQEDALPQYAIVKANEFCIKNCAAAICYPSGVGNTRKLYEKIQKRKIPIYNLKENESRP